MWFLQLIMSASTIKITFATKTLSTTTTTTTIKEILLLIQFLLLLFSECSATNAADNHNTTSISAVVADKFILVDNNNNIYNNQIHNNSENNSIGDFTDENEVLHNEVNSQTAMQSTETQISVATKRKLSRGKRYLDFTKGTRISWRTTVKNNILRINTLWAYGFGFRVNFPFPDKEDRRRPFYKRDVVHAWEDVLNGHGFDGRACILKSFCTAKLDAGSNIGGGMLFKLLQMFFSLDSDDKRYFSYLRMENCQQILHSHCPLSFNNISPYTDDV